MRTTAAIAAGLATFALVTSAATAPAQAEGIGVKDPHDTAHGSDLLAVQVRNNDRTVVVVTSHVNLRRDPASGSPSTGTGWSITGRVSSSTRRERRQDQAGHERSADLPQTLDPGARSRPRRCRR